MDYLKNNIHWLLRLTMAATFLVHGYPKLGGNLDMGFIGYLVGPFEVLGALFLILGGFYKEVFTRIGSALIGIIMLGAIFFVHLNDGWKGMEWQVLILSVSLFFLTKGNDS